MKKLVIVESPSKAKTIEKYLGRGYKVTASMGHLVDLPKSTFGIDIENDFTPKYSPMTGKRPLIKELTAAAKEADAVYLATDPDREGEAISWHLMKALKLDESKASRITFNEITSDAVKKGINSPRKIDQDLVDAYQARRVLDRIVGYRLSPLLWKSIKRGLSAGRVQSVTLRIVVLRENEIKRFKPKEYWNIYVILKAESGEEFKARFFNFTGSNGKMEIGSEEEAKEVVDSLDGAGYKVTDIKKTQKHKRPAPPFITSSLQQEASRRFGYSAKKIMLLAQNLYEGVSVGEKGMTGLITYMRTDSLRLSEESVDKARNYIKETYGDKYMPKNPRIYKPKENAQDAHEAIRPTDPMLSPDKVKEYLSADQYKIYKLIWERFTACQMDDAVYDTVTALIETQKAEKRSCQLKTSGSVKVFAGYTALYEDTNEKEAEKNDDNDEEQSGLPNLKKDEDLVYTKTETEQKFTSPPPRYTEASLIKTLEENGIGRPSTYAPTISTILDREYVEKEGRYFKPTALGFIVNDMMENRFASIVNVEFTARMEEDLDKVAEGKTEWKQIIRDFYGEFAANLEKAETELTGVKIELPVVESDVVCDKCGRLMIVKSGRFGKFLACPGYPECKNTKAIAVKSKGLCPLCGGAVLQKKSKNGNKYFGCENNPQCAFMTWDTPIADLCPNCGKTLFKKSTKAETKIYCADEKCGYANITDGYTAKNKEDNQE